MEVIDVLKTGTRIREAIDDVGMTVSDMADKISVSVGAVYRWCEGYSLPTLDNLVILSHFTKTPIDYLIVRRKVVECTNTE